MADAAFGNQFRKRKTSGLMRDNMSDDEDNNEGKIKSSRENHSEIERRRRNKMNAYINELSDMVPPCNGLIRKPDKLTILKMAVSYMKTLRGSPPPADSNFKPSFLSDHELKHLVLEAADGFLFVVACKSGTIMYVSDSVTPVLNHAQADMIDHSFYQMIHPEDIDKIKDQLATEETADTRILDLKTGNVHKDADVGGNRLNNGSRRNFVVRMKCGTYEGDDDDGSLRITEIKNRCKDKRITYTDESYAVVHCTGYIRSLGPILSGNDENIQENVDACLVAIGRLQLNSMPTSKDLMEAAPSTEFITRQTLAGVFSFVDVRVTEILGYRPVDLLGKSCYDFYEKDDVGFMYDNYEQVLKLKGQPLSIKYRFKHKNGKNVHLSANCYSFQNPYTDTAEYIVCTNNVVKTKTGPGRPMSNSGIAEAYDMNKSPKMNEDQKSPANEEDPSYMIQERPGMFPYPYRIQPGMRQGKESSGGSILQCEPHDSVNKRRMVKPASQYPPEKSGRHTEYSGGLVDENIVPGMYSEGAPASGFLAKLAEKHQHGEPVGGFPPGSNTPEWSGMNMYPSAAQVLNPALNDLDSSRREDTKMLPGQPYGIRPSFRSPEMTSPQQQLKAPRTPDQMSPLGNQNNTSQPEYPSNIYMSSSGLVDQDVRNPTVYSQPSNDLGPQLSQSSHQVPRRMNNYDAPTTTSEYQYYQHN